jgi:hypothetical protein
VERYRILSRIERQEKAIERQEVKGHTKKETHNNIFIVFLE